jgi:hypothetical protein
MSRQDRGPGAPPRRGAEFLLRIGKITDEGADALSLRFRFRCCHVCLSMPRRAPIASASSSTRRSEPGGPSY